MKKILSMSLALTLVLGLLAGCGNTAGGGSESAANVNLEEFYQTIFTDPENTPAMAPIEGEMLDAFYPGLSELELKQLVAYMPMITAVACEIVMVECANAADAQTVKGIFEARIAAQVGDHFNYPAVIEAWEKEAQVVVNGNYAALFLVSGMGDQVVSNFNAAIAG